jgi:hypothetical protein
MKKLQYNGRQIVSAFQDIPRGGSPSHFLP